MPELNINVLDKLMQLYAIKIDSPVQLNFYNYNGNYVTHIYLTEEVLAYLRTEYHHVYKEYEKVKGGK